MVSTGKAGMEGWPWADELDALVAAPDHHELLMENEHVRVLNTVIPPGEKTAVHTHRWPAVFHIQSWGQFVRYDDADQVMVDSREVPALADPGNVLWSDPLPPHALENVGDTEIRILSVELKNVPV